MFLTSVFNVKKAINVLFSTFCYERRQSPWFRFHLQVKGPLFLYLDTWL